jgi:hypothetical protein
MYLANARSYIKCAYTIPHYISDFRMIILVYDVSNASGLGYAKNLRTMAEKTFASSTFFLSNTSLLFPFSTNSPGLIQKQAKLFSV